MKASTSPASTEMMSPVRLRNALRRRSSWSVTETVSVMNLSFSGVFIPTTESDTVTGPVRIRVYVANLASESLTEMAASDSVLVKGTNLVTASDTAMADSDNVRSATFTLATVSLTEIEGSESVRFIVVSLATASLTTIEDSDIVLIFTANLDRVSDTAMALSVIDLV